MKTRSLLLTGGDEFLVMAWKVLDSTDVAQWGKGMFLADSAKIGVSGADNKNNINPVSNY